MSNALRDWYTALRALENEARAARRSLNLRRETARALAKPPYGVRLNGQRLSSWIPEDEDKWPQMPRDFDQVWAVIRLWSDWTGNRRPSRSYWQGLFDAAQPVRGGNRAAADGDWAGLVRAHLAWECVRSEFAVEVDVFQRQAVEVARGLAHVRDDAANEFTDAWRDPQFAERFVKRTEQVLSRCLPKKEKILTPAEAALLALIPLVRHTHVVWSAARWSHIGPMDLKVLDAEDPVRDGYQKFFLQARYDWLIRRAEQVDLPDRDWAGEEIAGWLFRRWLQEPEMAERCPARVMLAEAGPPNGDMAALLTPSRVEAMLSALRLDPDRLAGAEQRLSRDDQYFEECRTWQPIRRRLICLLLAMARGMTIDLMDLPEVVVEHLGIPHPAVDLDELRATISGATWETKGRRGIRLTAECFHEAVLEALGEYVEGVDTVLNAVSRAVGEGDDETLEPLARLWTHASPDGVAPAPGDDGKRLFEPQLIRFRLDERRVRELLMGVNLYGDRALAIRELYQNALDACRLRQAYEQEHSQVYDRRFDYSGRIEFNQDWDAYGRYFLECRDNGVGMGEKELREVFSQAGAKFTEQRGFWEDQAAWRKLDPPVELYPNSRFGIGVFSYFMLADEIEVTTRRMDRHGGRPGQEYTVVISGPGHLFHINKTSTMGDAPGTRVRLYLRDPDAPSCVRELRRLLGLADFHTTARHKNHRETWEPGRLKPRRALASESVGLEAYGSVVPWTEQGQNAPVVWWCEQGGALLADGLLVSPAPAIERGMLARSKLRGAVVNLTGKRAPRLSVDRTQVLSDVQDDLEELLGAAAADLAASDEKLLSFRWISSVAQLSPRLADIVAQAATAARRSVRLDAQRIEMARVGCFPQDIILIDENKFDPFAGGLSSSLMFPMPGNPPDHVTLWRLLAHRAENELEGLARFVPELALVGPVVPALPSDLGLFADVWARLMWPDSIELECPGRIVWTSMHAGVSARQAASRATALGLGWVRPERFTNERKVDPIGLALLSMALDGSPGWLDLRWPVPPGHLVGAFHQLDVAIMDAADRLREHGFRVPDIPRPPNRDDLFLLSRGRNGRSPWLSIGHPVPIGHILSVGSDLGISTAEVIQRLTAYGMHIDPQCTSLLNLAHREVLPLLSVNIDGDSPWIDHTKPIAPGHLLKAAMTLGISLAEAAARCVALGLSVPGVLPDGHPADDRAWLIDRALLSKHLEGAHPWLEADQPVPPRHLILAKRRLKIEIPAAVERLARYGLVVSDEITADSAHDLDPELLSQQLDGSLPWLDAQEPVPLRHLIRATQRLPLSLPQAVARLRELGMNVPDLATSIRAALARVPRSG